MANTTASADAEGLDSDTRPLVEVDDGERRARDEAALVRALTPTVELAIRSSVRRDPKPLADAIFPVIGPAIRKAIAAAIGGLIESMNRAADSALSLHAVRWRWEAWRTGRTFGDVVISHQLRYSVEQIFLIQRDSGLLLAHIARGDAPAPDVVSGMLTAIQEFVRESFNLSGGDALHALQVGELTVLVEQGPAASVAAVVRGYARADARVSLQELLETLHDDFNDTLTAADCSDETANCLEVRLHDGLVTELAPPPARRWRLLPIVVIATILLGSLAAWILSSRAARGRWDAYVSQVRALPGVVVLDNGRRDGGWFVRGLRDPLATDPQSLLESAGIAPHLVAADWRPYLALEPSFVLTRARSALAPPPTVSLATTGGAVTVSGVASHEWVRNAERVGAALGAGLDMRSLRDADAEAIEREARAISEMRVRFPTGSARPTSEGLRVAGEVVERLRALAAAARAIGASVTVAVVGRTDETGSSAENAALAADRAAYMQRRIADLAIVSRPITQQGARQDSVREGAAPNASTMASERTAFVLTEVRHAGR